MGGGGVNIPVVGGFEIPGVGASIYGGWGGQNTMGRGFDIPCVGGQNTMGRGFDKQWVGVNIPWVSR